MLKHWNLAAFAPLAAQNNATSCWIGTAKTALLCHARTLRRAMYICSHAALLGIESLERDLP